jgi:diacylglycerol kinase (ATP)
MTQADFAFPALPKTATLIYNPIAGRQPQLRQRQVQEATVALTDRGMTVKLAQTSGPGAAGPMAREAARGGDNLILVCGGDGTINEVVNGLAPGETTLGILPGGTANIIAKELNLPHDPVRAARQLRASSPRRIALGRVTWPAAAADSRQGPASQQRYFLSVSGVGFDAYVVYKLSAAFKRSLGVTAYVVEALRQVLRHSFPVFVCRAGGREFRATFATIQRTSLYAGWLRTAPGARFFEPQFHVCLFKSRNRARYLVYAAAVLARQHARLSDVELLEAGRISCAAADPEKRIRFELDGELAGELPATFEIVPNALTLLVPEAGSGRIS